MRIFLLDLWNDLRAKRVWPVAVALLAALVAVPVLLAKPAEDPTPPAPTPAPQAKASVRDELGRLAQVRVVDEEPGDGSALGVFNPDDPFKPPEGAVTKQSDEATQSDAGPGDSATTQSGDTGSTGDTGSSGGGTSGDTGQTTTPPNDGDDGKAKTATYRYMLDVTFSANGRTRHIKGLEKLDMLPSQASPLLIFMGVSDNAGNAVFLVDSTLDAAGEGKCKPSASDCAFLYLGAGSEEEFNNDDGDSYRLRIDEIRKVKVGSGGSGQQGSASDQKTSKSASASLDAPVEPRRFSFPILTDLVVQSGNATDDSTGAQGRR
jgi:hypothetical protein